jgi:aspartyl-tRNA synthetase
LKKPNRRLTFGVGSGGGVAAGFDRTAMALFGRRVGLIRFWSSSSRKT